MLCVHVVAIFVMVEFTVKRIESAEVRPADIARHDLHLGRLFHHGVVDGIRRDVHHVVMIDTDKSILVFFLGVRKGNLCSRQDIRRVRRKFIEESRSLEAEDTAVPEEPSRSDILLCGFQVRLFDKALDIVTVCFNVAVTRFRTRRRDAEGDHETFLCKFFSLAQAFFVSFGLADHMIRRRHENDIFRIKAKASKRNCRSRIAAHRFQKEANIISAHFFELVLGQEILFRIAHDILSAANTRIRLYRALEQGRTVKKTSELFRHKRAANRPKARSATTTQNQVNHL